LIIIGLATALLLNRELLFSLSGNTADEVVATSVDLHHEAEAESVAPEEKTVDAKESTNSAADGLSRYYANLRGDMDGEGHFENGLSIYFCYQQRTIVLIEYSIPYL
jgi:hypothetical protein